MMTALVTIPLLTGVGVAVDYSRVLDYRSKLNDAADAAALAAISEGSAGRRSAFEMIGVGEVLEGREDAKAFFEVNFITDQAVTVKSVTSDIDKEENRVVSTLSYQADVKLAFAGLLGKSHVTLTGEAEAEIQTDAAIDFYLLLDNTPSMGIGATTEDITTLVNNTPDKCAFACHALNDGDNYYNLAKELGVSMRIDVVRQATQNLTKTAKNVRKYDNQYRMAVYSFGAAATALGLTEVAPLSGNLDRVKRKTNALDLMTIPHQGYDNDQQTSFDKTLAQLNATIPDPGSGLGGEEPQKLVFFVSDGVGDSYKPSTCTKRTTNGRCQEPIDTKVCDAIKARGIKIAALYTTYLPLPTNSWYNDWIKPFQSEIGNRMRDCATPGLYFEVSPSEGISEAMDALFLKSLSMLRLIS